MDVRVKDEHYLEPHFCKRLGADRRFWTANGGRYDQFLAYAVVDGYGSLVASLERPLGSERALGELHFP